MKFGEKLTLKPGEMILGRISESFSLPADCAGAIEGRSSYARLGLSVHASGGFINPGWRGHMPLTLVNHSANTIRIPVGTPLCQLMIIGLSGPAEADYAARTDRKYPNDTGGPSYWWRDKLFREIREAVAKTNLPANVFDELDELVGNWDDEQILERLERFISEASHGTFGNADELLDGFSKAEDRHEARGKRKDFATQWSWAVFTTIAVAVAFISFPGWIKVVLGLVAILSVVLAVASVGQPQSDFLTTAKLAGLRSRRDSPRPP
ncbi:MAG: dCTP deaminase [Acidimicrobiaceae bacterium]|nr:dCTP deaminase [Acidimicrobiaceae bacterium]